MRLHNRFSAFWPAYEAEFVDALCRVEHLTHARFEPVYSMRYEGYMDLAFECDGAWLVLPLLRVEGISVMLPENQPVSWPTAYASLPDGRLRAIEEPVVLWLRAATLGRFVNDEMIRQFRDRPHLRDTWERARSANLLGAAPYASVLRTLGPARYAQRMARGRSVALRGADAANGAALLSAVTRELAWECQGDADAVRWFAGLPREAFGRRERYDLYLGPRDKAVPAEQSIFDDGAGTSGDERTIAQVEPIPTDITVSFDPEDAPVTRRFAVAERTLPVRLSSIVEPVHGGGSRGHVALVVRDDAAKLRDADIDAAEELARGLQAEGFEATVGIAANVDPASCDVVHVFGLRHGAAMVELLRRAEETGTPVVVTPHADDRRGEATSGSSGTLLIPRVTNDTVSFDEHMRAFASRRISNLSTDPWYGEDAAVLMARASAAIVVSSSETEFLRERFGYRGITVPIAATVPLAAGTERIGSLVGPDAFVLVHAPIEPRCNQLATALAAQRLGYPLVLLGPLADIEYARYVNEVVGPGTMLLRDHELTDAELAGLYARARVAADVGWSSRGLHRLARAAACGAALVASLGGYASDVWGELAMLADPASMTGIEEALALAWEAQPLVGAAIAARTAERCDPFAGLIAVVSAYQQASLPVAP